jgi:hypothetical protein
VLEKVQPSQNDGLVLEQAAQTCEALLASPSCGHICFSPDRNAVFDHECTYFFERLAKPTRINQ